MKYLVRLFGLLLLFSLSNPLSAQLLDHRQGEIIIQFQPDIDGKDWIDQQPLLTGGRLISRPLNAWVVRFVHTEYPEEGVRRRLLAQPAVVSTQFNQFVRHRATLPDDPLFSSQWQHHNTGQIGGLEGADFNICSAWDVTTGGVTVNGDTIVVCVIDNGIDVDHEDLVPNLWINRDEIPDNNIDDDGNGYVDDDRGWNTANNNNNLNGGPHGTSVTGIVGARGNNGIGVTGVNWTTKVMVVRNNFLASESEVLEAYSYALDARIDYDNSDGAEGAYVVATNASWGIDGGQPENSPIWCALYDSLGVHGILNVGATTNTNTDVDVAGDLPTTCPSKYLIGVTNVDTNNERVILSGFGATSIDIGAYGEDVFTTINNNGYGAFGGTSASAPAVTGAIGLLCSAPLPIFGELLIADPAAAACLLKDVILESARPNATLAGVTVTGGTLDIGAAMDFLSIASSTCFAPTSVSLQRISSDGIEVRWNAISSAQFVNLRYRPQGSDAWIEVMDATSPYQITALDACRFYEVQLISQCIDATGNTDIFLIETDGCCRPPTGLRFSEITSSTARVDWDDVLAAVNFEFRFRPDGSNDDWVVIPSGGTSLLLSELDNCTTYEVEIRSDCDTAITDFAQRMTFTTIGCGTCLDANYCEPGNSNNEEEWIAEVNVGNLFINTSGPEDAGYFIYGELLGSTVARGADYPVSLLPGHEDTPFSEEFIMYVDWNQDGIFATSEKAVEQVSQNGQPVEAVLSIPESATLGLTRLRVVMEFLNVTSSCGTTRGGEIEDYCLRIIESPGCAAPENLTAEYVEETETIVLSWSASAAPGGDYLVRYRVQGTMDEWVEITTSELSVSIEGFAVCELFDAEVASLCADVPGEFVRTIFNSCSSTNEFLLPDDLWSISPNPARDNVQIRWEASVAPQLISVFDISGALQLTQVWGGIGQQSLVVRDLPAGVYLLRVTAEDGQYGVKRLLIQ